jgi:hypothetical protein
MAICTKCGAILHEDDLKKHICLAANLPTKGKELHPQTLAVDVP